MTTNLTDSARMKRNLQLAFDLHEAGVSMMKQNLRRKFPDAAEQEINQRLQLWLEERPLLGELVKSQSRTEGRRDFPT
jgi:hypothetical protein